MFNPNRIANKILESKQSNFPLEIDLKDFKKVKSEILPDMFDQEDYRWENGNGLVFTDKEKFDYAIECFDNRNIKYINYSNMNQAFNTKEVELAIPVSDLYPNQDKFYDDNNINTIKLAQKWFADDAKTYKCNVKVKEFVETDSGSFHNASAYFLCDVSGEDKNVDKYLKEVHGYEDNQMNQSISIDRNYVTKSLKEYRGNGDRETIKDLALTIMGHYAIKNITDKKSDLLIDHLAISFTDKMVMPYNLRFIKEIEDIVFDATFIVPTIKNNLNQAIDKKINLSLLVKSWEEMYGENLKTEYVGLYKNLLKKDNKEFTLKELCKEWKDIYGENFRTEYSGLYKNLQNITELNQANLPTNPGHIHNAFQKIKKRIKNGNPNMKDVDLNDEALDVFEKEYGIDFDIALKNSKKKMSENLLNQSVKLTAKDIYKLIDKSLSKANPEYNMTLGDLDHGIHADIYFNGWEEFAKDRYDGGIIEIDFDDDNQEVSITYGNMDFDVIDSMKVDHDYWNYEDDNLGKQIAQHAALMIEQLNRYCSKR